MSHPCCADDALVLENAGLRVRRATLLQGIDARFAPGRVTALLGPNGAGKTTLMHLLAGLLEPTQGRVLLGGRPLRQWPAAELARSRAMMTQGGRMAFDFRADDVVALGRHPHRRQPAADEAGIVAAALAHADVTHLADRHFGSLSGGEQARVQLARVQLARVLAQLWHPVRAPGGQPHTRWMLLDEPIAALDWSHQMMLMETVRRWAHEQGAGVIAIVHDLNIALRYADDALVLAQGRAVAHGSCASVLTPALVAQVWRVTCRQLDLGDRITRLVV